MRIEYLLVTKQEEGFCESRESFIKLLESNSQIRVNKDILEFNDGSTFLKIDFQIETNPIKNESERYFHLKLNCHDESKIIELTKVTHIIKAMSAKLNISNSEISTLWDDISIYYATQAYPLINEIENLMRSLILKFMIVNVGMNWSKKVVPKIVKEKISNKEKANLEQRNQFLVDKLHNADFIVLSEMLFEKYRFKEIGQLDNLISSKKPEDIISFKDLKKDYSPVSNWDRYFSELIKYKGETLKTQWDKLYELRNKVAHNKTLEKKDFDEIKNLTSKIKPKLEEAINNLNKLELSPEQKDVLIRHENNRTPLHDATSNDEFGEVHYLIYHGADVNARDKNDITPLHIASRKNNFEITKLLIENGADINSRDILNWTPLHCAVFTGNIKLVKFLIFNGANINAEDEFGETPLCYACYEDQIEMVKFLVASKANINVKNTDGQSLLHSAVAGGSLEIFEYLVNLELDIRHKDNNGLTLLHCASMSGSIKTIARLLEIGFDLNEKDNNGNTALYYAENQKKLDAVKFLIKSGANKD